MRFVWHESSELPTAGMPVVIKTNMVSYHIAVHDGKVWWIKTGKRYAELEKILSGSERMTGWAYVGVEV